MAGVVYEGVGGGGSLFAGLKLFLLQRLPLRSVWKQAVEENGGKIVLLEKQADYIIADHTRKDAPPGSISWKWIEQSVKNGELGDTANYPAGPAEREMRDVGSGLAPRYGRIPFTAEDDRLLMKWVTQAERNGSSIKGNEIYKQLEKVNPRHTFQSWRDRWVKKLSQYPRSEFYNDGDDEGPLPLPTGSHSRQPVRRSPVHESASNTARNPSPQTPSLEETVDRFKGRTAKPFTKPEKQLLIHDYEDIMNIDEDKAISAWSAWASAYPSHSAQEWHNYFNKKIIPMMKALDREAEHPVASKLKEPSKQQEPTRQKPRPPASLPHASPHFSSRSKGVPLNQKPATNSTLQDPEESPERVLNSQPVKNKTTDSQVGSSESSILGTANDISLDPTMLDEELFERDLTTMAESLELVVDLHPTISGRAIPLFRLWQVVNSPGFSGHHQVTRRRLWARVAKELNFNEFKHPEAADELRMCYNEILADFEQVRVAYYQDLTESQEKALLDAQLLEEITREPRDLEEDFDYNGDVNHPAPIPIQATPSPPGKRGFSTYSQGSDSRGSKRQRADKGKTASLEIPSTPSDVLDGVRSPYSHSPSPSKGSVILGAQAEVHEEENDSQSPIQQPKFSRTITRHRPTHNEPETQDFMFDQPRDPSGPDSGGLGDTEPKNDWDEVQAFIDHHVALAYEESVVIDAMIATTLETGNAAVVMEGLAKGNGIPVNMEGVWTAQDDRALYADPESEEFRQVLMKHKRKRISRRREFLESMRPSND